MPSSFTVNKGIEQPAAGSYNDTWSVPVNTDWALIDSAFGGVTTINVTGLPTGGYTLSLTQYQPPNIVFIGTLTAAINYVVPAGVGGVWTIFNNTTGAFNLSFVSGGGGAIVLPPGQRSLIVCDGSNVQFADSQSLSSAESFASAVANTAQSNAETYAASVANTAQSNAESYAASSVATEATARIAGDATTLNTAETFTTTALANTLKAGSFNCINGTVSVTFASPFPTACASVVVEWEYASPDVGNVVPGSRTVNGFQYINGNAGACTYIAVGH